MMYVYLYINILSVPQHTNTTKMINVEDNSDPEGFDHWIQVCLLLTLICGPLTSSGCDTPLVVVGGTVPASICPVGAPGMLMVIIDSLWLDLELVSWLLECLSGFSGF